MLSSIVPSMMSTNPDKPHGKRPHPPRKKQPKLFSRVRPGQLDPFAPSAIAMSTLPSLSTTIQSIENRVQSAREVNSAAVLGGKLAASAGSQSARDLPPLPRTLRGKEDGVSAAEGAGGTSAGPSNTALSAGSEAAMQELASSLGSVPDMHGMTTNLSKAGQKGRSIYPDSNLAEAWLNEVLDYGIREFGDTETVSIPKMGGDDQPLSGTERMKVGRANLRKAGLNETEVSRIYRALYVYSVRPLPSSHTAVPPARFFLRCSAGLLWG